ncbi:nicotinamide riboside transporter PnuC [uncultured Clostridium sp.]|jgi:nicotinamide mononucleotide transporter|uniref:nicotinamide riboside transporter PnuC n=1 Tax=uncultured Clostridium sp. TaxID=59620 RepID=UPI002602E1FA|nr:nicotinamide riboside transporter PnuC [uncultured Clostridium sp.]
MQFFKQLSPFQKGFLVFFIVASFVSFFIPLIMGQESFIGLFGFFSIIGLISAISGVLASIFQVRAKAAYYLWFLLNTVTYAIICLHENLYGQFIQNFIILLPLEVAGFIAWKKHIENSKEKKLIVRRFTKMNWVVSIILAIIAWGVYAVFLKYLPNIFSSLFGMQIAADPQFKLDALTSVMTIFAVYITSKRFIEQWYFWLVANAGIIIFIKSIIESGVFSMSDLSGAIVLGQYGVISLYGLYSWIKMYKKQKEQENVHATSIERA